MKNLIFLSALISILCLRHAEVNAQLRPIAVIEGVLDVHDVPDSSSIYIGQNAGVNASTTTKNNTTLGSNAGARITSAMENTIVGSDAGKSMTIGERNTFIGNAAGRSDSTGKRDAFFGYASGARLASGRSNTFIGSYAGNLLENAFRNTFIGSYAGAKLNVGYDNIFIGYQSGPSLSNVSNRLYVHNRESEDPLIYGEFDNDLIRINGEFQVQTGSANILDIGSANDSAGYYWSEEDDQKAFGLIYDGVGISGTNKLHLREFFGTHGNMVTFKGDGSVGIGQTNPDVQLHVDGGTDVKATDGGFAQLGSSTGTNIAIDNDEIMARNNGSISRISINRDGGDIELLGASPNSGNVGIGILSPEAKLHVTGPADANASSGGIIVCGTTTGTNIAMDRNEIMARNNGVTSALYLNFEGSPVHMGESIGIDIGTEVPTADLDVKGSARFRNIPALSSTMDVRIDNSGFLTTSSSDLRLKRNIVTISNALEKVDRLRGVSFNWKDDDEMQPKHGLIAQEVREVVPELVFENDGFLGINYSEMAGLFVEAIKDLKAENEQLRRQCQQISFQMNQLEEVLASKGSGTQIK